MSMIIIPNNDMISEIKIGEFKFVSITYFEDKNCEIESTRFYGKYRKIEVLEGLGNSYDTLYSNIEENPDYSPQFIDYIEKIRMDELKDLEKEDPNTSYW